MNGIDICDFIANHSSGVLSLDPIHKSIQFFDKLLASGQILLKFRRRQLVGVAAFYRTNNPQAEIESTEEWSLPQDYTQGKYLFIDQIVVHKDYRHTGIIKEFANKLRNLTPSFHSAFWLEDDGKWRVEERAENMQTNCGVLAFDKVTGALNGRANVISLSTLAKMAQDNEFLMFPMLVGIEDLYRLPLPFIVHSDFHFEAIRGHQDVLPLAILGQEKVYVLSQTDEIGELVDDDIARTIKGSKGKKFFKQIFMPFADPLNTLGVRANSEGKHYPFAGAANTLAATVGGGLTGGPIGAATGAIGSSILNAKNPNGNANPTSFGSVLKSGLVSAGTGLAARALGSLAGGGSSSLSSLANGAASSFLPPGVGQAVGSAGQASGLLGKLGNLSSILSPTSLGVGGSGSGFGTGGGAGGVTKAATGFLSPIKNLLGIGQSAGQQTSSLFGKPNLGTVLGGLSLAKGLLSPQPQITSPQSLEELRRLTQAQAQGGGLSPAGQAAYGELNRGIAAGPAGIVPPASDQYFDSALANRRRIAGRQKENLLEDVNRIAGGPYSSEAIQTLSNFDEQQRLEEQQFVDQYTEMSRQQGLQAHQKYIELALQGDNQAYQLLAQSLGGLAEADLAIQAFQAGLRDGKSKQFTDLGGQLLGNSLDPIRQYAAQQLVR